MASKITVRGIVFSALFAALLVVLSFVNINLGFTPVPITLGNMGVMLAGAMLGAGYGFFSMFLVVFLTTLGLPMLHGTGGIQVLVGPTGGYVWMYPVCALLTGYFVTRVKGTGIAALIKIFLSTFIFGSLLCYVTGVPWLAHVANYSMEKALGSGFFPYLPGDAIKAFVTALVVLPIRAIYPASRLTGTGRSNVVKM